MTSIKARLADALRKAGETTNEYESAHLPIDRIVNTVLSLPGIAIVDRDRLDATLDRLTTETAQCSSADHRGRVQAQVNEIRAVLAAAVQAQEEQPK